MFADFLPLSVVDIRDSQALSRPIDRTIKSISFDAIWLEIPWTERAFDAIFNGVSNQIALYYVERFLAWA